MIIDILSDLHFDAYFPQGQEPNPLAIKSIFDAIFFMNRTRETGDVLVVAGDIGHYNHQNIEILKIFRKEYYKNIVCVLGNHDYYLNNRIEQDDYGENSFKRVEEMRELINAEDGMYCLNGTVVEIDGVRFGGADSSYSNAYLKAYYPLSDNPKANNEFWKSSMPDYKMMFGVNQYNHLYKIEIPKIERIYKECDVMVTHVNPSFLDEHLSPGFAKQRGNMFYCFNGHKYMRDGSMKYWIFGHTHDRLEYEHEGVKCICNAFGYPAGSCYGDDTIMKSIEI